MKRIDANLIKRKRALFSTMQRDIDKMKLNASKMREIADRIAACHAVEEDRYSEELAEDVRARAHHLVTQGLHVLGDLVADFAAIPEQSHDR